MSILNHARPAGLAPHLVGLLLLLLTGCQVPVPSLPAAGDLPVVATSEVAAAPTPAPTLETPLSGPDRLVIAIPDAPSALDPHVVASPSTFQVTGGIYETLVDVGEDGRLRPGLAERWAGSEDKRHWLFWLRAGARFHDGRPVTGEDVAYSIERLKDPALGNPRSQEFALISTVVLSGTQLVGLHLSEPDSTFPYRMAADWAAVVPDDSGETLSEHPIGSGPYELEVWAPAQFITLKRSEAYSLAIGGPAEVAFRTIAGEEERVAALRSGQVDVAVGLSPSATLALKSSPGFTVVQEPSNSVRALAFNERTAPWNDRRVLRALNHAIDRQALVASVWSGLAVPVAGELSPASPFYTDTLSLSSYDPALARSLLQEAAITFTANASLTLTIPDDDESRRLGEALAGYLTDVGLPTELQPLDWIVFMNQVYFSHSYVAALTTHLGKADPLLSFTRYITSSQWNYVGHSDEAYQRLVEEASRSADALSALQALSAQEGPGVHLAAPLVSVAMRGGVKDCYLTPSGGCDLNRLRKEP